MWQLIAIVSGASVTLLMAVANVAYSMSLATGETLGIPNKYLFAVLGVSLDLLMVCTPFAYHHATKIRRVLLAVTFCIASLYSIHAMHGFLKSQTVQVAVSQTYHRELELRLAEKKTDFKAIEKLRERITAQPSTSPVQGFEWALALSMWFVNSTIWFAFFGSNLTATIKRYMEDESHGGTHGEEARTDSGSNHRSDRRDGVRGYSKNKRSLI